MRVSVTSIANNVYTTRKFDGPKTRAETYVFMQGDYYEGVTVDHSIEKMPFRKIAEYLAPELARQQFLPTKDAASADLLIIVHWGTTIPYLTTQELTASRTPTRDPANLSTGPATRPGEFEYTDPLSHSGMEGYLNKYFIGMFDDQDRQMEFDRLVQETERMGPGVTQTSNGELLGYGRDLRRANRDLFPTEEERALRFDLQTERYFIILKAYDLHQKAERGQIPRPVWTVHLNMRSPGINFATALGTMSTVAADYAGRTTDRVKSIRPSTRAGTVNLAPLIILGVAKATEVEGPTDGKGK